MQNSIDMRQYGWTPVSADEEKDSGELIARITAVHRERYEAVCAAGPVSARLKAGVYYGEGDEDFPTAGDFVRLQYNDAGDSLIAGTLERRSLFSRRDPTPGRGEQAVAANFDYVFIVTSLNQEFNLKRLERYLTAAWQSGGLPVVVLTKADLAPDAAAMCREAERLAPGVGVFPVSAVTGQGLEALGAYLSPGKTVVLLGSSGVGKSSLINALAGREVMDTGEIREDDARGRHTTTHRQLLMLPCHAMVIDTPGMRQLGMWDVSTGLGETFGDVEELAARCRFRDCTHTGEPGCAVRAAMEAGQLERSRWDSYCKLKQEAAFDGDKAAYLRQKQKKHKGISKAIRRMEKGQVEWE